MLTYCSLPTFALLLSSGIAFYISIYDFLSFAKWKYNTIKYNILCQCDDIILDEWLQHTVGYLTASYGLAMMTILLYSFPLPHAIRRRFIQYLSLYNISSLERKGEAEGEAEEEGEDQYTIEELLYEPGGLSRLISIMFLSKKNATITTTTTTPVLHSTSATTTTGTPVDSIPILQVHTTHDMHDLQYQEDEQEYEYYTQDTNKNDPHKHHPYHSQHLPITSSASSTAESTSTPTWHDHDQEPTSSSSSAAEAAFQSSSSAFNQIYRDILQYTLKQLSSNIHPEKIQRIGISAGLALFIQMKYSPVARQTLKNVMHGSIAIGLSSLILGSCASLYAKRRLWKWIMILKDSLQSQSQVQQQSQTQSQVQQQPQSQSQVQQQQQQQQLDSHRILSYGHGIWMSIVYKFQHDERFRRQWKAFVCTLVLYVYRKRFMFWNHGK
jgi:hypothetical protein